MTPQTMVTEQESTEQPHIQEQFVRQVEDRSLPAQQVLVEQQELHDSDESQRLFVP